MPVLRLRRYVLGLVVASVGAAYPAIAAEATSPGIGPAVVMLIPALAICSWLDKEGCDNSDPRLDVSAGAGLATFRYSFDTSENDDSRSRMDGNGTTVQASFSRGTSLSRAAAGISFNIRGIAWWAGGDLDPPDESDGSDESIALSLTGLDALIDYCFLTTLPVNACLGGGYSFAMADSGESSFAVGIVPHALVRADLNGQLFVGLEARIDQVDSVSGPDNDRFISYGYLASVGWVLPSI